MSICISNKIDQWGCVVSVAVPPGGFAIKGLWHVTDKETGQTVAVIEMRMDSQNPHQGTVRLKRRGQGARLDTAAWWSDGMGHQLHILDDNHRLLAFLTVGKDEAYGRVADQEVLLYRETWKLDDMDPSFFFGSYSLDDEAVQLTDKPFRSGLMVRHRPDHGRSRLVEWSPRHNGVMIKDVSGSEKLWTLSRKDGLMQLREHGGRGLMVRSSPAPSD